VFPGLWQCLSGLAEDCRLVAPREVLKELEIGGEDDMCRWAKNHESMFRDLDAEQAEIAKQIVNDPKFKGLFDIDKETPEADPFVIALAVIEQRRIRLIQECWVVVADEGSRRPGKKPRIPDVCTDDRYQVECIRVLGMFEQEGWQFVLTSQES